MDRLTICIPTYNRLPFLEWTVAKLKAELPDAKILVSDNASTDDTRTIQLVPGVEYLFQPKNIGAFPNMRAALLGARTEYATYCGDDDYLLAEPVASAIRYLDLHQDIIAYIAPCELWDETNQAQIFKAFYRLEDNSPHTYARADALAMWNFVITQHVWPEHIIWRTSALERALQPCIRPYWAFVDLGNALEAGRVHFSPEPFYRNIFEHPCGPRTKLGDQQCLTDFEEYRSGLELLAAQCCDLANIQITYEMAQRFQLMIGYFIYLRLEVAHRILTSQRRSEEAEILEKRMRVTYPFRPSQRVAA